MEKIEVSQMGEAFRIIGFIVIVTLYVVIGLMSAAGSIFISQRIFTPKAEQIFYGIFFMPIAAFYLAFTAYFGMDVLHELHAHGGFSVFEPGQATAVPLAYGVFCAAYDACMAAYFYTRRSDWGAAWESKAQ